MKKKTLYIYLLHYYNGCNALNVENTKNRVIESLFEYSSLWITLLKLESVGIIRA